MNKFLSRSCPCCETEVSLEDRVSLIKRGYITCGYCRAKLTPTLFSGLLPTVILGVPCAALLIRAISPIPEWVEWGIVFSVGAWAVPRLCSPLLPLQEVYLDEDTNS